jgi:hypothetical protein
LLTQAGDGAEQQRIGTLGQAQQALQVPLGQRLAGQPVMVIRGRGERVGCRIPDRIVDAVEDAGELVGAVAQHSIEAAALLGGHDFARVTRTHGGDGVGKLQSGFHERDVAVGLDAVEAEQRGRQAQGRHRVRAKQSPGKPGCAQ